MSHSPPVAGGGDADAALAERARRRRGEAGIWAVVLAASLLAPLAVLSTPTPGEPVGALFVPWTEDGEVVARVEQAAGAVLSEGAAGVVLALDQAGPARRARDGDFAARLRAAGAIWVFNGSAAALLCGAPSN